MLMHRTETFLHLISNTPIQCSCGGSSCLCGKEKKNKRMTLTEKNIDHLMEYIWTKIKIEQIGLGNLHLNILILLRQKTTLKFITS